MDTPRAAEYIPRPPVFQTGAGLVLRESVPELWLDLGSRATAERREVLGNLLDFAMRQPGRAERGHGGTGMKTSRLLDEGVHPRW